MNSTLKSIENLLNRFDELSEYHNRLIEDFNNEYSEFDNPLKDVQRNENEQKKTLAKLFDQFNDEENHIDRNNSLTTFDQFHRSIRKNCYSHRPPSYSSTNSQRTSQSAPISSSSSFQLIPFNQSFQTKKLSISSPIRSKSTRNISLKIETSNRCETIEETLTKISSCRSNQRKTIRYFSLETANRLSQPKKSYLIEMKKFPYKPFLDRIKSNNSSSTHNKSFQRIKTNSNRNEKIQSSFSSSIKNDSSKRNFIKESIRTIPFRFPMPLKTKLTPFQDSSRKYFTTKSTKFISKTKLN